MKKVSALLLCLLLFSSFCLAEDTGQQNFNLKPLTSNAKTSAKSQPANIFRPIGQFFRKIFRRKQQTIVCYVPVVTNLFVSRNEIKTNCSSTNGSCAESQKVEIITTAVDHENDVLAYIYKITAGEIIGTGAKVIWDLSSVPPGTYTITAGADDGCGVCGVTKTQTVKIIECPNCN